LLADYIDPEHRKAETKRLYRQVPEGVPRAIRFKAVTLFSCR
jgi:hypothetical protein